MISLALLRSRFVDLPPPALGRHRRANRAATFLLGMLLTAAAHAQNTSIFNVVPLNSDPSNPNAVSIDRAQAMDLRARMSVSEMFDEQQRQEDEYRRMRLMSGETEPPVDLVVLAPLPPVLFAPAAVLADLAYSGSLVPCAGEPFFMAYAGLQVAGRLPPGEEKRVALYLKKRDALAAALRGKLAASATLAPEARERALREFAISQESALRDLEREAEAIRERLSADNEGAALARRRDAVKPGESPAFVEYCSALLAAEFHAGFSVDQRDLLHAIALEALLGKPAPPADPPAVLQLLPATARLPRPQIADEAVTTKLRQFAALRESLASELRGAVLADEKSSKSKRTKRYAALAQAQAARFAELQQLAEELRPALERAIGSGPVTDSSLPAGLVQQVGRCLDRNAELRHEASRLQRAFALELDRYQVRLATRNGVPVVEIVPPNPSAPGAAKVKPVDQDRLARLQAANEELARNYRALAAEMEAATREVTRYRASLDPASAPDLGRLTAQLARAYAARQESLRFRDYRDAVLVPGLSPAQRRLLLQASLSELEQHRLASMD